VLPKEGGHIQAGFAMQACLTRCWGKNCSQAAGLWAQRRRCRGSSPEGSDSAYRFRAFRPRPQPRPQLNDFRTWTGWPALAIADQWTPRSPWQESMKPSPRSLCGDGS